ncbi:predicted protein [Scheffersomyces stipitis CBS 6054]|uniref:Uncharacterized protein n=1 Tax=Scheffersomyces stipitis (strain ATCC 58785 / CBS 6054 / NBRC 10063 / NRRL Y-11545) TaxID=322104 RepID=A3LTE4_PICST|nr:predicted protein [Scheffersomyces stipitis CBS 6054]ABN66389.1 predicted protein [Scheffersomyces stipitis CBS 6054]
MKVLSLLALATVLVADVSALVAPSVTEISPEVVLHKRAREVIINKDYKKQQEAKAALAAGKTSTSEVPRKWFRTVSSTIVEVVTPTVIAGVTFGAKPPATTDGMEPWVSLNKNGSPKTVKPAIKNGRTKNASPTYGTWFATATTKVYSKEELKAHNMEEDEVFEDVQHIEEDPYEHSLNPIIRCTPDLYRKKGVAKDQSSEPFCFPHDNQQWKKEQTYFITWYSRFFDDEVENVKVHLSYVKESAHQKGFKKREISENVENENAGPSNLSKRSAIIDKGGVVEQVSFYSSDWLKKSQGYFPVTVDEKWIGDNDYYRKVLISLQPDNIPEEDFDFLEHSLVIEISKGSKVSKEHLVDLKKLEEKYNNPGYEVLDEGVDFEKYYVMMTMPTCVILAAFLMYIFVYMNKVDLSHLKKKKFARKNTTHRKIPFISKKKNDYTALPTYNEDLTKND